MADQTIKFWVGTYPGANRAVANTQLSGIWRGGVTPSGYFEGLQRAGESFTPSFLALSPNGNNLNNSGRKLFAVNEIEQGSITQFDISNDGTLVNPVTISSGGNSPCHLLALADALWVANYGDGVVTRIALDPINGDMITNSAQSFPGKGHGLDPERQGSSHAHYCLSTGDGVLVMDLGTDLARGYPLAEPALGDTPMAGYPAAEFPPGTGPRHGLITPDGYLIVVGELDALIHILTRAGAGSANEWQHLDSVPAVAPLKSRLNSTVAAVQDASVGRNYPAHITQANDLIISGIRGADLLAIHRISLTEFGNPTLEPLGNIELGAGAWPRHHANLGYADNGELLVVVAGQNSNELISITINPSNGQGKVVDRLILPDAPSCILPV